MASEAEFQKWYAGHAAKLGLAPNPDDPQHFYDYRAAFKAGATPDVSGHWPSQFKQEGHPRMVIGGVNTKTGKRMPTSWEKRKLSTGLGRRIGRAIGGAVKKRETSGARAIRESKARKTAYAAKVAKLGAGRKAQALLSRPGATRKVQGAPTKPLTHSEIAAARQEEATRAIGMGGLFDALTGKKKP